MAELAWDRAERADIDQREGADTDTGQAPCFPRLRGTVVEVIRLAGDPDRSDDELFRVVAADPGLSIQVLSFANSAAYRPETEVTSITRAVSVIGTRALRNIAICFAACESTPLDAIGELDFPLFLEDSLRRGASAELLARTLGLPDPDEAFTAGLLQDFGVVALVMHEPSAASEWMANRREPYTLRREMERALFGFSHDEIGGQLASVWKLPDTLRAAVTLHHSPEEGQHQSFAALLRVCNAAEAMADVFIARDKNTALRHATERLEREFGLSKDAINTLIEQVPQRVEIFAQAMGIRIQKQPTLQEVLEDIANQNKLLAEMNLSYMKETRKLELLLHERDEATRELRLAKARLERLATTDPLTLLSNRRHFETSLERELIRAQRQGTPISVVVGDVDHFKVINDTYGHPFGDMVLRMVASALRSSIRSTDLVARVGGEEFAVLLPGAARKNAIDVGERLRKTVESLVVLCGEVRVRVTMSFGGVTVNRIEPTVSAPKASWWSFNEADQALYSAKRSGRNRVAWRPKPIDITNDMLPATPGAGRPAIPTRKVVGAAPATA
jgi:diguanylate cyclase (GGDEF)-like protein